MLLATHIYKYTLIPFKQKIRKTSRIEVVVEQGTVSTSWTSTFAQETPSWRNGVVPQLVRRETLCWRQAGFKLTRIGSVHSQFCNSKSNPLKVSRVAADPVVSLIISSILLFSAHRPSERHVVVTRFFGNVAEAGSLGRLGRNFHENNCRTYGTN